MSGSESSQAWANRPPITTRASELGGREFHHIGVPVLEASAAESLMERIAGPEISGRPGFDALIEALGGYTLSVELAATFLQRFPEVEPEEYLADLRSGRVAELEAEVGSRTLYGATLDRALELLWARLSPRVRQSWQLAACFAQAPASSSLSDACGLDRRARAALRDFHLIQTDSAAGWSMHRLLREFGKRAGDGDALVEARKRFVDGCTECAARMDDGDEFQVYAADRNHYDLVLEGGRRSRLSGLVR